MASRQKDFNQTFYLLLLLAVVLMGALITFAPSQVRAEGNPPTNTPTITLTVAPAPTLEPTLETGAGDSETGSKGIDGSQTGGDEAQGTDNQESTSPDDNAAPISNSPTSGLFGTNLCLVGVIVVAASIVMFMVVYGVIQRVRS